MLRKYNDHHIMVKSIIRNVYVNRSTETEVRDQDCSMWSLFLSLSRFPVGFIETPNDAHETAEMTHTSIVSLVSVFVEI